MVSHEYAWEPYHSPLNRVTGYTPSKNVSAAAGLCSLPNGFDQAGPDGRLASRTFNAPPGFGGKLLYQRLDILTAYAAGRSIVTFGWGEREAQMAWPETLDDKMRKLYQEGKNVWRGHWVH